MFCTQCGNQVGDQDRFCAQCARPTGLAPAAAARPDHLMRDRQNRKIAGVCGGFANYLDVDPVLVRIIWLVLAFGAGVGFIAYIIAWIVMPNEPLYTPVPGYAQPGY